VIKRGWCLGWGAASVEATSCMAGLLAGGCRHMACAAERVRVRPVLYYIVALAPLHRKHGAPNSDVGGSGAFEEHLKGGAGFSSMHTA
jgi:hypothetical protein